MHPRRHVSLFLPPTHLFNPLSLSLSLCLLSSLFPSKIPDILRVFFLFLARRSRINALFYRRNFIMEAEIT